MNKIAKHEMSFQEIVILNRLKWICEHDIAKINETTLNGKLIKHMEQLFVSLRHCNQEISLNTLRVLLLVLEEADEQKDHAWAVDVIWCKAIGYLSHPNPASDATIQKVKRKEFMEVFVKMCDLYRLFDLKTVAVRRYVYAQLNRKNIEKK